jgi:hypothetical protein
MGTSKRRKESRITPDMPSPTKISSFLGEANTIAPSSLGNAEKNAIHDHEMISVHEREGTKGLIKDTQRRVG